MIARQRLARRNFLLFITDQHRVDYLGCYGHPILRTPQINSIAARGVRFERFYVATPVCMPNRATLMTGRMPSVHGARSNGLPLSLRANTFVDALRASGLCDCACRQESKRWQAGHDFSMQLPFYGFEHVDLCTAHGAERDVRGHRRMCRQTVD
jgi:hypothetical protein